MSKPKRKSKVNGGREELPLDTRYRSINTNLIIKLQKGVHQRKTLFTYVTIIEDVRRISTFPS